MYSVDQYIRSFRHEAQISINLFHKIPAGGLDYRPSPSQRTTLELLRYLSFGPYNTVRRIVAGDWSKGIPADQSPSKDMPPSDFPSRMLWQANEVERLVRSVPVTALLNDDFTVPWGVTLKKGEALVELPLKWMTGYRMQLFLYLKAAGAHHLGTAENWRVPL